MGLLPTFKTKPPRHQGHQETIEHKARPQALAGYSPGRILYGCPRKLGGRLLNVLGVLGALVSWWFRPLSSPKERFDQPNCRRHRVRYSHVEPADVLGPAKPVGLVAGEGVGVPLDALAGFLQGGAAPQILAHLPVSQAAHRGQ